MYGIVGKISQAGPSFFGLFFILPCWAFVSNDYYSESIWWDIDIDETWRRVDSSNTDMHSKVAMKKPLETPEQFSKTSRSYRFIDR